MSPQKQDKLLINHEYDGITEYDNPTPGWWHVLFLCSVIFGIFYFFIASWSPFYTDPPEQVAAAQAAEFERLFADIGELEPDTETILSLMGDEKWSLVGAGLFRSHCVSCHGSDGGGVVGPNLTDEHYKNLENIEGIYTVIDQGAAGQAMPAWNKRLIKNEMVLLSAYVASLRGTTPIIGKEAEGEVIAPWPEPTASAAGADVEAPDSGGGEQSGG